VSDPVFKSCSASDDRCHWLAGTLNNKLRYIGFVFIVHYCLEINCPTLQAFKFVAGGAWQTSGCNEGDGVGAKSKLVAQLVLKLGAQLDLSLFRVKLDHNRQAFGSLRFVVDAEGRNGITAAGQ